MFTTVLNENEITFNIKKFGLTFGKIKHLYSSSEGNLEFYTETIIANDIPILGFLLNWLVVPFFYSKRTAKHWIKHNIEETGQTEKILPILYKKYAE